LNAQTAAALFTLMLSSFALHAAELAEAPLETITWVSILPARPAGKEASSSEDPLSDRIQPFVAQHWPQVKHVVVRANPRRVWQMIGNGDKVCQVPSIRTPERERIAYFSNTFLGPPMQLIVHRDLLPRLPRNAQGEVELAKLLANTELHGALVDGRSYGGFIDAQLARMPHRGSSLTRYSAADYGSKLLPMLGKGRMDYTIDYEVGIAQARSMDANIGDLISQPIAGASKPLLSGVVCPRTPWGLAAIQGIDKVLGTPAGAAMLRESAGDWLTPETRQIYGARMDAFFKSRATPSVIR
jgi:uncharacterized protein (TIGR02285 family)